LKPHLVITIFFAFVSLEPRVLYRAEVLSLISLLHQIPDVVLDLLWQIKLELLTLLDFGHANFAAVQLMTVALLHGGIGSVGTIEGGMGVTKGLTSGLVLGQLQALDRSAVFAQDVPHLLFSCLEGQVCHEDTLRRQGFHRSRMPHGVLDHARHHDRVGRR